MSIKLKAQPKEMVVHPAHYNEHPLGLECIDVIEHCKEPLLFNALKYIWRVCWGNKGGPEKKIEDLQKAVFYLEREIRNRKSELEIEKLETAVMLRASDAPARTED